MNLNHEQFIEFGCIILRFCVSRALYCTLEFPARLESTAPVSRLRPKDIECANLIALIDLRCSRCSLHLSTRKFQEVLGSPRKSQEGQEVLGSHRNTLGSPRKSQEVSFSKNQCSHSTTAHQVGSPYSCLKPWPESEKASTYESSKFKVQSSKFIMKVHLEL